MGFLRAPSFPSHIHNNVKLRLMIGGQARGLKTSCRETQNLAMVTKKENGLGHCEQRYVSCMWSISFLKAHTVVPENLDDIIQSDTTLLSRQVQNNYLLVSGFIEITCEGGKPLTKAGNARVNVCFPSTEQVSTQCPEQRPCFRRIILLSQSCKPGTQRRGI